MASPQYCLRWNNHHPNFISVFKSLLEDEDLVDVTLSVDGQYIKAHKVILSASSPYFKSMFAANPCEHPVVILGNMKFTDLKTIVQFMYCGEINITDEQLPDILNAAETLQVWGLFDPNEKEKKNKGGKPKKKKMETSNENVMLQGHVSHHRLEGTSEGNTSDPQSSSVKQWINEQTNENEFHCEHSTQVEDVILPPNVCYEEKLVNEEESKKLVNEEESSNSLFLDDKSAASPPSPTDRSATPPGPIRRRRNSTVQQSENFNLALEAVRTGQLGFCKAAKTYGLNNRTLWLEYKRRGYPTKRSQPLGLKLKQAGVSSFENDDNFYMESLD